jgi:hypothetical protein
MDIDIPSRNEIQNTYFIGLATILAFILTKSQNIGKYLCLQGFILSSCFTVHFTTL